LPKGAIVIMRRSGGLRFTSEEVAVHRDGRVTTSRSARAAGAKDKPQKLTPKQLSALRVTLTKSRLDQAERKIAKQPPDGYAYEIVARVGRKVQTAEVFTGSIPDSLQPLVKELSGYLAG
jgi:hypothetical protein